jgi:transcriptional regulator with XRE-family HTH domain
MFEADNREGSFAVVVPEVQMLFSRSHHNGSLSSADMVRDNSELLWYDFPTSSIVGTVKLEIVKKGKDARPPQRLWPPNSIAYFRSLKGWNPPKLAEEVGTSPQQIRRLEKGERQLDPDWASRLSKALGVPAEDIGFSDSPDVYPWATRAIPVMGGLHPGLKIELQNHPTEKIGSYTVVNASIAAITIMPGTLPLVEGMFLLIDREPEDMSIEILERQATGERFIIRLFDGTTWWRRIQLGSRKNRYHLSAPGVEPILDVEIDTVNRVVGVQPGRSLPPTGGHFSD